RSSPRPRRSHRSGRHGRGPATRHWSPTMTRGHTFIAVTALAAGVLVAGCASSTKATQPNTTRRPPLARPTTAAEPTKQPAPPPGNVINPTSNGPATNATPVIADDSECVRVVLANNVSDVPTDQVVQGICHNHRP